MCFVSYPYSLRTQTQFVLEKRYLEATRIYRNYRTTKDEVGRPNPLLAATSNKAARAKLRIDREAVKHYLSSTGQCLYHTLTYEAVRVFCIYPICCVPCICLKMANAADLVDPAADAHTLELREKTLYYKVTPYNEHGIVNYSHWSEDICVYNMNIVSKPCPSEPRLGFDGFIPKPTGMNINIEQAFPLELIERIHLVPINKGTPFKTLVVDFKGPNFKSMKVVQVDMPLNGPEFKKAVMNAKERLIESNQTLEQTNPALFHEFVEYMASVKNISFADWQAANGGLHSAPTAVAIEVAPPMTVSMSRGTDLAGQLRELKELFDAGALTAEEFAAAKQSTLSGERKQSTAK